MGNLTQSILGFVNAPYPHDAPVEARTIAARGFIDCIGVMIAGAPEPVTQRLLAAVREQGGRAEARLLLSAERGLAEQATLVGTAAAHALDYDDYAFANHPSALLVPAILAEAEVLNADGAAMIDAYLTGYEVWSAIMKREPDHLHSKGWHPTGVFGPAGVAAALARLGRLDAESTGNALGLAVAHGGGVMDNFGTDAKSYQGARAAAAGVTAVRLARHGVTAGPHALDGSGGLLAALSPRGAADLTSTADYLGRDWYMAEHGLNIKLHPTVGASQRAIDAAIQLHRDAGVDIDHIQRVVATVGEKHAAVMRFPQPRNGLEAKFSLQFGVAAGLITGRVGLTELKDEFVQRQDLQDLMARVEVVTKEDDDPIYPVGAAADIVELYTRDGGHVVSEPVRRARGHGHNPVSDDELWAKFADCTAGGLASADGRALFEQLLSLERLPGISALPTLTLT
jgi:aconitate decarboxylase